VLGKLGNRIAEADVDGATPGDDDDDDVEGWGDLSLSKD
jgi:hypothetical protein